jgi:hypothetical protein
MFLCLYVSLSLCSIIFLYLNDDTFADVDDVRGEDESSRELFFEPTTNG